MHKWKNQYFFIRISGFTIYPSAPGGMYQNLTGNLILAQGHKSDCGAGGRIDGEVTSSCKVHDLIVMM
jgi:hypothetical protein